MELLNPNLIQKPYSEDMPLSLGVTDVTEIFANQMCFSTIEHKIE